MTRVFVSYSREDSKLAHALRDLVMSISGKFTVDIDRDSEGVPGPKSGELWFSWILNKLRRADVVLSVLTPNAVASDWVLWEAGLAAAGKEPEPEPEKRVEPAVAGKTAESKSMHARFRPIRYGIKPEELPAPLRQIAALDGAESRPMEDMLEGFVGLLPLKEQGAAWKAIGAGTALTEYLEVVREVLTVRAGRADARLRRAAQQLRPMLTASHMTEKIRVALMSRLLGRYLESVKQNFEDANTPLNVPAVEYPSYLLDLLATPGVEIRAIALVDEVEQFWWQQTGEMIGRRSSATTKARRVFVFPSDTSLHQSLPGLLRHAAHQGRGARPAYEVRVMSRADLTAHFRYYEHDFSVVEHPEEGKVLARYGDGELTRSIEFTADADKIVEYHDVFEKIWSKAHLVPHRDEYATLSDEDAKQFVHKVFRSRNREMSWYIDIRAYDRFEEKHAHFVDMMETMLRLYRERRHGSNVKVLEMGAGTGLFTRRLLTEGPVRVVAVEYDDECYAGLRDRLRGEARVTLKNENSVSYDPPGKFDFVFSSFSDHHIATDEDTARRYLENVKRNLHGASSFIVGDEFLGEHNLSDRAAREQAIITYHDYILSIARAERELAPENERDAYDGLMRLEEAAKQSGLAVVKAGPNSQGGDYKVPLDHYLVRLRAVGLEHDPPILIGPRNEAQARMNGGIWVVRAYLPDGDRG